MERMGAVKGKWLTNEPSVLCTVKATLAKNKATLQHCFERGGRWCRFCKKLLVRMENNQNMATSTSQIFVKWFNIQKHGIDLSFAILGLLEVTSRDPKNLEQKAGYHCNNPTVARDMGPESRVVQHIEGI